MSLESENDLVDISRESMAINTADFIAASHDTHGNYRVSSHWGPEGEIYRGIQVWALADVYRRHRRPAYLETCRNLLERFRLTQRPSGGWALCLGKDGNRLKISDAERLDTEQLEDACIAGAVLKAIFDFEDVGGGSEFHAIGEKALAYLAELWDPATGRIAEDRERSLTGLRSNPDAYHFMILLGLYSWAQAGSAKAQEMLPSVTRFVETVFLNFNEHTMPLMVGYHFTLLSGMRSQDEAERRLKPHLDRYLRAGAFRSKEIVGGYGHHDGPRGVVLDELHVRSAAGLAMAMRAWDLKIGTTYYQAQDLYKETAAWIDSMYDGENGGFFEYQDLDGSRDGKGSSGEYVPVFWIFGTLTRPFLI